MFVMIINTAPINMFLPSIKNFLDLSGFNNGPIHIYGANYPIQALFVTAFIKKYSEFIFIICKNLDAATLLASDIDAVSQNAAQLAVKIYPGLEPSPYSPITPSMRARFNRIDVLNCLVNKQKTPTVILTSLSAALQATTPKDVFSQNTITLITGKDAGTKEVLIKRLLEIGYSYADTVVEPSWFSWRGEILDVFVPGNDHPTRVEFFDTSVEKIRFFNVDNQKTFLQETPSLVIPPAREVILNPEVSSCLKTNLKNHCDQIGINRKIRDPIIETIRAGLYPERADTWAAFAYETPGTLLSYLITVVF